MKQLGHINYVTPQIPFSSLESEVDRHASNRVLAPLTKWKDIGETHALQRQKIMVMTESNAAIK